MIDLAAASHTISGLLANFFSAQFLLGFAWAEMLLIPFIGFTFTDPADFIFITLIPVTMLAVAWQHLRRPCSARWLKFAERAAFAFGILGPMVPLAALYLAAWSASGVLGHWPRYMIDDPKHVSGQGFELFSFGVSYAMGFGGWSIVTFWALLLHLRRRVPAGRLISMTALSLAAWMLFVGEPGGLYKWWLD